MPVISVIVPVYNVEKYLPTCLESILKQSFVDFEIILIDDGSTDSSSNICDDYVLKDKRIIVIHKKNEGVSSARNAGLDYVYANSPSEYISFVDSDDYVASNFLEQMLGGIKDCDICCCDYYYVNNNNITKANDIKESTIVSKYGYWERLYGNVTPSIIWNKLYRRHVLENIRYPDGYLQEDEYISHEYIDRCNSISLISSSLYFYISRKGSIVNTKGNHYFLCGCKAIMHRLNYFMIDKTYNHKIFLYYYRWLFLDLFNNYYRFKKNSNYLCIVEDFQNIFEFKQSLFGITLKERLLFKLGTTGKVVICLFWRKKCQCF